LKDRLGSGLGPYKVEDITALQKDIAALREANEAAQNWMAAAVEHHSSLSAKNASLESEKAALSRQLDEERLKSAFQDKNISSSLERDLQEKTQEVGETENNGNGIGSFETRERNEPRIA